MSEIKTLEKLRKLTICDNGEKYTAYHDAGNIGDEIEAEIAERFMELPVDADGVPIRIGDTVCEVDVRVPIKVMSLTFYDDCVDVNVCGMNPNLLRHVKPRTLEDVLEDCINEFSKRCTEGKYDTRPTVAKYADEIRELMGASE